MRPVISECSGPIFTKFSGMVDIWEGMINLTFVLQSLMVHCYGDQFLEQISRNFHITPPSIIALAFYSGLDNNADRQHEMISLHQIELGELSSALLWSLQG